MRGIAKAVADMMKFKHPTSTQYKRMSIKTKQVYHSKAANVYKRYASFFSGTTRKTIMEKYKQHLKLSKAVRQ